MIVKITNTTAAAATANNKMNNMIQSATFIFHLSNTDLVIQFHFQIRKLIVRRLFWLDRGHKAARLPVLRPDLRIYSERYHIRFHNVR